MHFCFIFCLVVLFYIHTPTRHTREGRYAAGAAGTPGEPPANLFGKTVFVEDAAAGVKTEAADAEDAHMARQSAMLVGSADAKLCELVDKYKGVRIADGKGRHREEYVVVDVKVSPAPDATGMIFTTPTAAGSAKVATCWTARWGLCPAKSCQVCGRPSTCTTRTRASSTSRSTSWSQLTVVTHSDSIGSSYGLPRKILDNHRYHRLPLVNTN